MSPQPSPAASHHSTNSPDPSKLVHTPPGSQLTGNSHEAIGQSIQKICVMTHVSFQRRKSFCEFTYFPVSLGSRRTSQIFRTPTRILYYSH